MSKASEVAQLRAVAIFGLEPEEGFSDDQYDLARWTLDIDKELGFMSEGQEQATLDSGELRQFVLESAREQAEFAAAWDSQTESLRPLDHIPEPSPHLLAATKFCLHRIGAEQSLAECGAS